MKGGSGGLQKFITLEGCKDGELGHCLNVGGEREWGELDDQINTGYNRQREVIKRCIFSFTLDLSN